MENVSDSKIIDSSRLDKEVLKERWGKDYSELKPNLQALLPNTEINVEWPYYFRTKAEDLPPILDRSAYLLDFKSRDGEDISINELRLQTIQASAQGLEDTLEKYPNLRDTIASVTFNYDNAASGQLGSTTAAFELAFEVDAQIGRVMLTDPETGEFNSGIRRTDDGFAIWPMSEYPDNEKEKTAIFQPLVDRREDIINSSYLTVVHEMGHIATFGQEYSEGFQRVKEQIDNSDWENKEVPTTIAQRMDDVMNNNARGFDSVSEYASTKTSETIAEGVAYSHLYAMNDGKNMPFDDPNANESAALMGASDGTRYYVAPAYQDPSSSNPIVAWVSKESLAEAEKIRELHHKVAKAVEAEKDSSISISSLAASASPYQEIFKLIYAPPAIGSVQAAVENNNWDLLFTSLTAAYNPDQERDENGRWGSGSGKSYDWKDKIKLEIGEPEYKSKKHTETEEEIAYLLQEIEEGVLNEDGVMESLGDQEIHENENKIDELNEVIANFQAQEIIEPTRDAIVAEFKKYSDQIYVELDSSGASDSEYITVYPFSEEKALAAMEEMELYQIAPEQEIKIRISDHELPSGYSDAGGDIVLFTKDMGGGGEAAMIGDFDPERVVEKVLTKFDVKPNNLTAAFNPDQERDENGRWSSGGSSENKEIEKIVKAVKDNEGYSVKPLTGEVPKDGYMVAVPNTSQTMPAEDFFSEKGIQAVANEIKEFIESNEAAFDGGAWLGLWHAKADGIIVFDVVDQIASRSEAIQQGIARDQISIYDVVNEVEIQTGGTGGLTASGQTRSFRNPTGQEMVGNDLGRKKRVDSENSRAFRGGSKQSLAFNPDQPRDADGKWGSGGGSAPEPKTGKVDPSEIKFGADLSGRDLSGMDLRNVDLNGVNLTGANLYGANLEGATLTSANLTSANLYGANLRGADLTEANLTDANLRSADLHETGMREANLEGANLRLANLSSANLWAANLRNADLTEADLREALLHGANLTDAILRDAVLKSADLTEADLTNATLDGVNFRDAILNAADLEYTSLRDAVLIGAKLENANLRNADLRGANFATANLIGANLSYANLSDAHLRSANLTDADLSYANLISADLWGANLKSTDLSYADLNEAKLIGTLLTDTDLSRADLTNANLEDATLTDVNFTGANLTGTNFINATVTGGDFTDAIVTDSNLFRINLDNVTLSPEQKETIEENKGSGLIAIEGVSSAIEKELDKKDIALKDIDYDNYGYEAKIYNADDDKLGVIQFSVNEGILDLSLIRLEAEFQNQGTAEAIQQAVLGEAFDPENEIDFVTFHANIDIGGYAWAKTAYPTEESWEKVKGFVSGQIYYMKQTDEGADIDFSNVEKALASDDPRAIQIIHDDKTILPDDLISKSTKGGNELGRELLLDSDWYAIMPTDQETYASVASRLAASGAVDKSSWMPNVPERDLSEWLPWPCYVNKDGSVTDKGIWENLGEEDFSDVKRTKDFSYWPITLAFNPDQERDADGKWTSGGDEPSWTVSLKTLEAAIETYSKDELTKRWGTSIKDLKNNLSTLLPKANIKASLPNANSKARSNAQGGLRDDYFKDGETVVPTQEIRLLAMQGIAQGIEDVVLLQPNLAEQITEVNMFSRFSDSGGSVLGYTTAANGLSFNIESQMSRLLEATDYRSDWSKEKEDGFITNAFSIASHEMGHIATNTAAYESLFATPSFGPRADGYGELAVSATREMLRDFSETLAKDFPVVSKYAATSADERIAEAFALNSLLQKTTDSGAPKNNAAESVNNLLKSISPNTTYYATTAYKSDVEGNLLYVSRDSLLEAERASLAGRKQE